MKKLEASHSPRTLKLPKKNHPDAKYQRHKQGSQDTDLLSPDDFCEQNIDPKDKFKDAEIAQAWSEFKEDHVGKDILLREN